MDKCIFLNSILAKEQLSLKNSYKEDIKNYKKEIKLQKRNYRICFVFENNDNQKNILTIVTYLNRKYKQAQTVIVRRGINIVCSLSITTAPPMN